MPDGVADVETEIISPNALTTKSLDAYLSGCPEYGSPNNINEVFELAKIDKTKVDSKWASALETKLKTAYKDQKDSQMVWPDGQKPKSAGAEKIFDQKQERAYTLGEFDKTFSRMADNMYAREVLDLLHKIKGEVEALHDLSKSDIVGRAIAELDRYPKSVREAKLDYVKYSKEVVPYLVEATRKINVRALEDLENGTYKGEVVLGNGADPILWAVRASRWGRMEFDGTHLVELDIGRNFLGRHSSDVGYEYRAGLRKLLEQNGVQPDGRWIDTGYFGNIAVALINVLDPKHIKVSRYNEHISLLKAGSGFFGGFLYDLARDTSAIEVLTPRIKSELMKFVDENSARSTSSPGALIDTESGVHTEVIPTPLGSRIRAYASQQAVVRSLLPRELLRVGNVGIIRNPEQKTVKLKQIQ